ncbi:Glycosidase [Flexibacter flexilis DSM 6793]|uniref:Glycosidase n=1 Tax=Flexibacter flexilis DSM 6793 TaxID=927664 RepID=A0A1I1K3S7_9BACT|nr:alpha-amylase family glycosyl hydrolase [Flexibacter flexilis]SFC52663.1 Glycosidase [Flexibacter flexilis DSM 6793]
MKTKKILANAAVCLASLAVLGCKPDDKDATPAPTTPVVVAETKISAQNALYYEVFVRNFSQEGTLAKVEAQLDSIQNLGANVLWLMPIHPISQEKKNGTYGSPYAVKNYYAIDPLQGDTAAFRSLVKAAHQRKMYVVLDWVANHTGWDNPWITEHPEYYTKNSAGQITHPPGTNWLDVADLNYANTDLRNAMINAMKYWVTTFNIDGYRCDHAGGVPADFWKAANDSLRRIKPMLMFAEEEELAQNMFASGFDVCFSWSFYDRLKATFAGSSTLTLSNLYSSTRNSLPADKAWVYFSSNHDKVSWDEMPSDATSFKSQDGARAAAVITHLLPNASMVYNGQEVGSTQRINLFEKQVVNWNTSPEMRVFYKKILGIRNKYSAFTTGAPTFHNQSTNVLVFSLKDAEASYLVAVNVRNTSQTVSLPSAFQGTDVQNLYDNTTSNANNLTLAAYQFVVLQKK